MEFLSPARLWFLLFIPVVVAGYIFLQHRRAQYALRFTNIALLDRVAPRRPQWRRHVAVVLALLATAACIFAFAQPKAQVKVPRERATIVVAIDVSLSMMATDVDPNRLEAAKKSAKNFVNALPAKFNVALVRLMLSIGMAGVPMRDKKPAMKMGNDFLNSHEMVPVKLASALRPIEPVSVISPWYRSLLKLDGSVGSSLPST